ncbi:MAG: hypothetical protein HY927_09455 [Elusimicrobia bacterium]|nr:hypothetical protein [Elusimicrobiota bacterium]
MGAAARGAPGHWTAAGVFVFPPRSLWRRLSTATVSAGWRGLRGGPRVRDAAWGGSPRGRASRSSSGEALTVRDPLGLYVHVPAELDALKEYFILQRRHPFLEALEREAAALDLPAGLPLRTLYIGGAGAGALSSLEADEIAELLAWLRRRFGPEVEQAAVEADASRLDAAKAAALARGGVDRVVALFPPGRGGAVARARRSAFYDGLAACRAAGIKHLCVDIPMGDGVVQPAERRLEADRAMALGADSVLVSGASATARGVAAGRLDAADGNLQLQHSWIYNASILGLGWGAVSHVRSRLVYGPGRDCFSHVRALLRGRPPSYEGARLSVDRERRAHIIRSLEDTGRVDAEAFRQAFGRRPEDVYPRLFGLLRREGGLVESEGGYRVADDREPARRTCAARFIDGRLLAALSRLGPAGGARAP